jgi:hypothetical protein
MGGLPKNSVPATSALEASARALSALAGVFFCGRPPTMPHCGCGKSPLSFVRIGQAGGIPSPDTLAARQKSLLLRQQTTEQPQA